MVTTALKGRKPGEVAGKKCKGILSGPPGGGKTWTGLGFPTPFFWDAEGSAELPHYQKRLADSGGWYVGPKDGTREFEALIEQVDILATTKHPYQTLLIDSISKIIQTRIQKDEETLGTKAVFGAQKKPAAAMCRKLQARLDRLDMNVWLIAHEIEKWGPGDSGERSQTGFKPDVFDTLVYDLDLGLRVEFHNKNLRTATVYKSRLPGFPMGDRFDLFKDGKDVGYANFAARYGQNLLEAPVKPITLASPEQVKQIIELLEVIKVPETETDKILDKAGVDEWSQLTFEQAATTINWIQAKVKVPNG